MPLTALKVKSAGPGRHSDVHGLCLVVRSSGSRAWVLRMQHKGKRREFGLGPAHDVPLAEARCQAMELRKMVRAGLDPVVERGLRRVNLPTFETVARECYESLRGGWKDQRCVSWLSSMQRYVFPAIGKKRVDAIVSSDVLALLAPIWLKIPDTAKRILRRIGIILDYAHIKGLLPNEVSLRSVTRGLPRNTKHRTHRAAMPYAEIPAFLIKLRSQEITVARDTLQLIILTAVRSNEARCATWGEFDLDAAVWSIPAKRMKMKLPHIIPLSPPAVALLRRVRAEHEALDGVVRADRLLFSYDEKTPISTTSVLGALRNADIMTLTVHGFRSSFTDWTAERTDYPKEVADKALAHCVPDEVEAAYRRTDFFEKRRALMNEWAAYLLPQP